MVRSTSSFLASLEAEAAGSEADSELPAPSFQAKPRGRVAPAATAARPRDGVPPRDGVSCCDGVQPGDRVSPGGHVSLSDAVPHRDGGPPGDGVPPGSKKRHVRSFEPSIAGTPKKGRPVSNRQKTCGVCGARDQDDDPTQIDYENSSVQSGDCRHGAGKLAIRWLYPRVEGLAQGNLCY